MDSTNVTGLPNIVIKTKIKFDDLFAFRIYTFYRKPLILVLAAWGILAFIRTAFTYHKNHEFPWDGLFIILFFLFIFPAFMYFSTKNSYSSDPRVKQLIIYTFSSEKVHLEGASFSSDFTWENVIKIRETKKWILLYHNSQSANIIPKTDVFKQDLLNLRMLIRQKNFIRFKLKV